MLEDDVEFNGDAGAILPRPAAGRHDLLFANRRAVTWHALYREITKRPALDEGSLREIVQAINAAEIWPPRHVAVEGDCYRITPAAGKRISLAERLGAVADVDWFIAGIGLSGAHLPGGWQMPARAAKFLPAEDSLSIGVAGNWLAGSVQTLGSSIRQDIHIPIGNFAERMTGNGRKG